MTVSRVLNNKTSHVSAETREKVLRKAREVGYRPNRAAQALVTGGKTSTVAVWVRKLASPYYAEMVDTLDRLLAGDGFETIIRGSNADRSVLSEWPVDGIIAIDNAYDRPVRPSDYDAGLPTFVGIGAYVDLDVDHVELDLDVPTHAATMHLVEQGCRRIAHISKGTQDRYDSRCQGYLRAVYQSNMSPEIMFLPGDSRGDVRGPLTEHIARYGCPDGFICRNDDVAVGVYRTLRSLGLRIPQDACIVGCDGTLDTEFLDTPISTIRTPFEEMCRQGWEMLKRRMADPTQPLQAVTVRSELVIRRSSMRQTIATP